MIWAGHVAHMGEMGNVYKILVIKLEKERLFGRPSSRWEMILKWFLDMVGRCGLCSSGPG
jgi:hypothetical protein